MLEISLILLDRLYTYRKIRENDRENRKCMAGYFALCTSFFTFCISRQGRYSRRKSKKFVVYYFMALIKHEICMKYEKCIVSVSYFVVCFAKTFAKCEIRKVYSRPQKKMNERYHLVCFNL